jgi:NADH:ubiquinone oxidoreductase subunit
MKDGSNFDPKLGHSAQKIATPSSVPIIAFHKISCKEGIFYPKMASSLNTLHGILKSVQQNGLAKTVRTTLLTLGQPKLGRLVGTDEHGNEYYENKDEVLGRDRWVLFKKWNFDATQVPPQYHQWLHRITDETNLSTPFFTPKHFENVTGTKGAFKTYNTTVRKVTEWNPQVKARE